MPWQFPRMTRRRFCTLLGGAAALGVYTWRIEPHWVEVVQRDLPIHNLPDGLVDHTLVQLSDLHVGPRVDSDFLIRSLKLVNDLQPDLICITGDFMTCSGPEQIDETTRVMEHLAMPPLGCFAILGNHDYGRGWKQVKVADRLAARLDGLGVQVLRNTSRTSAGLRIIGFDDLWSPAFQPDLVTDNLTATGSSLVLCHNPDAVDLPVWAGYQGWVLSGHTHGGQCKAPFLPPPILPVKNSRYTSGAFDVGHGRHLYINRALGYLRRVRFNVRPEITLFRLKRA